MSSKGRNPSEVKIVNHAGVRNLGRISHRFQSTVIKTVIDM